MGFCRTDHRQLLRFSQAGPRGHSTLPTLGPGARPANASLRRALRSGIQDPLACGAFSRISLSRPGAFMPRSSSEAFIRHFRRGRLPGGVGVHLLPLSAQCLPLMLSPSTDHRTSTLRAGLPLRPLQGVKPRGGLGENTCSGVPGSERRFCLSYVLKREKFSNF